MNSEQLKVCKFGGTSLADSNSVLLVKDIILDDPTRRFIIVSAPGTPLGMEREKYPKMTDLLIASRFEEVQNRFKEFSESLGCSNPFLDITNEIKNRSMNRSIDREWIASRGEWAIAKMFAEVVGGTFVDAPELIRIDANKEINPRSYSLIEERFRSTNGLFIIPGYYGQDEFGIVRTLMRNGSDISGAIVARGVGAVIYENWTDTNGVYNDDPHKNSEAIHLASLTFESVEKMNSQVLHKDTISYLRGTDIKLIVKNTFNRNHHGTIIFE